jgi:hypothetical protein
MKHGNLISLTVILGGLLTGPLAPARAAQAAYDQPSEDGVPAAEAPPTPPPSQAPPPMPGPPTPANQAPPPGQWTYTRQYGWIWMPYGDRFAHVPEEDGDPTMYVYGPAIGWCWVSAPWVWGWGPVPFFGVGGPWRFGWWGHGYGHWYGFRGGYRPWGWRPGYYPRGHWHPYRPGWGPPVRRMR